MRGAQSISTRRAYGVQRVCRVWQRARSSVYARRQATTSRAPCRRRGAGVWGTSQIGVLRTSTIVPDIMGRGEGGPRIEAHGPAARKEAMACVSALPIDRRRPYRRRRPSPRIQPG